MEELKRRAFHKKEAADELVRLSYQAQLGRNKQKYDEETAMYSSLTPLMNLDKRFSNQGCEVKERYLRLYSETNGCIPFDEWAESKWKTDKSDIFRKMFMSKLGEGLLAQFITLNFPKSQKGILHIVIMKEPLHV